ncbi:MAG: SDR family oxidoreductase, partial [Planctomycetota bacterium]
MSVHLVTGAFGYSGRYIAARLLNGGAAVRTVTNSVNRANPFGGKVEARPFHFDDPKKMVSVFAGAEVFYNTYWVRFDHGEFTHSIAEKNSLKLFAAAKEAGVRRVVHLSITNPSEDSALGYFRGKALLERHLIESGLSYSILRP